MDAKSLKSISPGSDVSLFLSTDDDSVLSSSCSSYSLDLSQDSNETMMRRRRVDVQDKSNTGNCDENRVDFIQNQSSLVSFDKLIEALGDFGFEAGAVYREEILRSLRTNDEGLVPLEEFVNCVKSKYCSELSEKLIGGIHKTATMTRDEYEDVAIKRLRIENKTLREENRNIKLQFEAMENACSKAEDEMIRIRKELQLQLENVRNLTSKLRSSTEATKSGCDDDKTIKESTITKQFSDQKGRKTISHQEAATKLLKFVEEVHRNLSAIKQTNRRVGRSCSLYRNSSCILASKSNSVTPQPRVVARAATAVGSERNSRLVAAQDKLPKYIKGNRSHVDSSQLIKKIVDDAGFIIDTMKPILREADVELIESSSENVNYFESSASKNVSDVIKRLHPNIPSTAVVTIMTRV